MRIMGVDPGSRLTGYGCVDVAGSHVRHVDHGTLYLSATTGKSLIPLEDRLLSIFEGLSKLVLRLQPQVMVVEKVFFSKNPVAALKLGHARGAAILAGRVHSLKIVEYSPTQVKMALVGHGHADKEQVAKMVQIHIGQQEFGTDDASDGLALAICHAFVGQAGAHCLSLQTREKKGKNRNRSLAEALEVKIKEQIQLGGRHRILTRVKKDKSS